MNQAPDGTASAMSPTGRWALMAFGVMVLALMLWATVTASLNQAIWDVGQEYWGNPWAVATLLDAYFAFLFYCLWVVYKEARVLSSLVWVVVILLTGSMGMALYLMLQVLRLKPTDGVDSLLLRRGEARP
jgi:hypothetical protein